MCNNPIRVANICSSLFVNDRDTTMCSYPGEHGGLAVVPLRTTSKFAPYT